ncbi:hypothetical protein LOK49_LG12G00929 [Camellia lanceoleosa]|uniref:Uncharacterized protein n=1 Tax=Camellia lanceoleosa TaxID=1840588 RepID=A0ACC0FSH3_9ERIC|nr:hypothetical protein LOK49_LG12G00929 [Camellia lanceoleosa]
MPRNLADFTTHFSFVISTANISSPITGGDGLAFFLVPNGSHIPPNTEVNHLHATALSFNSTNIGPQLNAEIVAEGDAHVSPEGIQLTPNEMNTRQSHAAG